MANPPPPQEPETQEKQVDRNKVARLAWAILLESKPLDEIEVWLNHAKQRSEQQRVKQLFE